MQPHHYIIIYLARIPIIYILNGWFNYFNGSHGFDGSLGDEIIGSIFWFICIPLILIHSMRNNLSSFKVSLDKNKRKRIELKIAKEKELHQEMMELEKDLQSQKQMRSS